MHKNPFSLKGRIRRAEYCISCFAYLFAYYFIWGMDGGRGGDIFMIAVAMPILYFALAQGVKRCHDIGKSGWWQFIPFYIFWLMGTKGQEGPNPYGPDPKVAPYE